MRKLDADQVAISRIRRKHAAILWVYLEH